jgi:hypothetical protein
MIASKRGFVVAAATAVGRAVTPTWARLGSFAWRLWSWTR